MDYSFIFGSFSCIFCVFETFSLVEVDTIFASAYTDGSIDGAFASCFFGA
jgi:hypothetical protein